MKRIVYFICKPKIKEIHPLYKQIFVCNFIAFIVSFLSLPYIIIFFVVSPLLSFILIIFICLYLLTIVLNYYKKFFLSRIHLFSIISLAIAFYASIFGQNSGIQDMLIALIASTFIVSLHNEKKLHILLALIPAITFIFLIIINFNNKIIAISLHETYQKFLYVTFFLNISLLIYLVVRYFSIEYSKSEERLTNSNKNLRLANSTIAQQAKEEAQHQIARDIQKEFLPKHFPPLKNFETVKIDIPKHTSSGDFYFMLNHGSKRIFGVIDVRGKGAPASLITPHIYSVIHYVVDKGKHEPKDINKIINQELCRLGVSQAQGAGIVILIDDNDPTTLIYSNVGLEDACITNDNKTKIPLFEAGGAQYGYDPHADYGCICINREKITPKKKILRGS